MEWSTTTKNCPLIRPCGSRRWNRCWSRRGWSTRPRSTPSIDTYEHKVGPRNGAPVVARAWIDPAYQAAPAGRRHRGHRRARLRRPPGRAHGGRSRTRPSVHNLVVCTLCSCYPWPVLGLPPVWYKSAPYRSRAVIDPRGVLARVRARPAATTSRCGSGIPPPRSATWCCPSARPAPSSWSEDALAALVTRDAMIGTARWAAGAACERRPRHGRHARHGAGRAGGRRAGLPRGVGRPGPTPSPWPRRPGSWNIDAGRHASASDPAGPNTCG